MAKSLTDKYNVLSGELDKVIHDANSEIARLRDKVAVSGTTEEDLRRKNHELMENWKEKCRKLAQVQVCFSTHQGHGVPSKMGVGLNDIGIVRQT